MTTKKRGKKRTYFARIVCSGVYFGKCEYIKKRRRRRRSTNGRVHRPAHESDVCPRCLKVFNVRGLGPHIAHCKVVRDDATPNDNNGILSKDVAAIPVDVEMTFPKKKRQTGGTMKVMVLFERGWWHATVSRDSVVLDLQEKNIVSCDGAHLKVRYTMDGSVEDILKEDIPNRVRSSQDNLNVTVLYDRRWYRATIPRYNVEIQKDNILRCVSHVKEVTVCYDIDSSVERVPREEVPDRIRLAESMIAAGEYDEKEDTKSIIHRIIHNTQNEMTLNGDNDVYQTKTKIYVKTPLERSTQRFKSGKYIRYQSMQGKSTITFPSQTSIYDKSTRRISRPKPSSSDIKVKLSVRIQDYVDQDFEVNITSRMLRELSVAQIVNRIFEMHSNRFPKELTSDRCTLRFARHIWNRNDLLSSVVPFNLGSSSSLTVTLLSTTLSSSSSSIHHSQDVKRSKEGLWLSCLQDRGIATTFRSRSGCGG
jgi:hypothetical protein